MTMRFTARIMILFGLMSVGIWLILMFFSFSFLRRVFQGRRDSLSIISSCLEYLFMLCPWYGVGLDVEFHTVLL